MDVKKIEKEICSSGNDTSLEGSCNKSRETPVGILRLDIGKPRRHSVEFKHLAQGEPASPQPSVDRLSVTFAEESAKSDNSTKCNLSIPTTSAQRMDKVHFPQATATDEEDSAEEDYSASVTAIMQRRASTKKMRRRNSRRASSPFSPDILPGTENGRRRSSVFTTSSGDTAITVDDNLVAEATKDEIFENIRLHKEVLSNVKMQPWNMRKKLRLVGQAKAYIKKHEGVLQERLAQSRSTKDMLARWNIYLIKKWQYFRRELANLSNWLIPWELKIKEIESHFGSVVASYFIFLRWLFWVNLVIGIILLAFVAIPEMLIADVNSAGDRKLILSEEKYNSTNFLTLWDFEGVFKYSPLFYGWYTNSKAKNGYRLPFAYFVTGLVVYGYSFFATLRKMAANSRMSKLSEKEDDYTFSWKLFTGWDYMIGNPETAQNRVASIVMSFKEAILEEAEKKREPKNWKIICIRSLVNTAVLALLTLSAYAVIMVVRRTTEPEANSTVWRRNEVTIVMSLISLFFPMLFEALGYFEQYHPRKQLRLQLARIMLLNLLNLYSLIFALFDKISDMTAELKNYENLTSSSVAPNTNNSLLITIKPTVVPFNINSSTFSNTYDDNILPIYRNITDLTTEDIFNYLNKSYSSEDFAFDLQNTILDPISFLLSQLLGSPSNTTEFSNISPIDTNSTDWYELLNITSYINFTTEAFDERFETNTLPPENDYSEVHNTTLSNFIALPLTDTNCTQLCNNQTDIENSLDLVPSYQMNYTTRSKLRSLCWETMFGQELVKLTVMDLIFSVLYTMSVDFVRGIFVRYMNKCWCWDLEKKFPQYGDFKVAENILHLINNQGLVWMGMFFSPGLVLINTVKLYILMYLRSWAVLTCNVPHEVIFRASRSNNFYYALLLMMLFLCVLPVGYTIVWIKPSWHCGPLSNHHRIFHIFTKTIKNNVPKQLHIVLDYIASPGIVIPLLVLLTLIIYYLVSLTGALREANTDLKIQLRRERTEERRKVFLIADRRRRGGSGGSGGSGDLINTPFAKWKKLLHTLPNAKSFDDTPKQESVDIIKPLVGKQDNNKTKEFFTKFIKRAARKTSVTSEDEENQNQDDATDNEQHDSLPDDRLNSMKEVSPQVHKISNHSSYKKSKIYKDVHQESDSPETKPKTVQIKERINKVSDIKKIKTPKATYQTPISNPKETRQDSLTSVWSDNIPVITISKTESAECILDNKNKTTNTDVIKETQKGNYSDRFKPKIKRVLRKQSTEVEDDIIFQVHDRNEKIIEILTSEIKHDEPDDSNKPDMTEKETAEKKNEERFTTTIKSSTNGESVQTESSTDYKDSVMSNT